MLNIMDPLFNGLARVELYRAQLVPELYPNYKPFLVHNWTAEEREMYCGIYGKVSDGVGV